jgi:RNA polymerase sigma factor (sigma-70 family)
MSPELLRNLTPQIVGALTRRFRDFAAAEDAVQEALIAATEQWPKFGVPENPRAWLITVASRRLTDQLRNESARRRREARAVSQEPDDAHVVPSPDAGDPDERDDTLALFFGCCHPSLSTSSAIALTLRAVGGLTTAEIARAFLVPEATMAQRISRAKQTIRASGIAFGIPDAPDEQDRSARLDAVLQVLYLVFNEGYASSSGRAVHRVELSNEAIRLTRMLHAEVPHVPEAAGLLALMLLTDARRAARTGPSGELIPLEEQDRSTWNRAAIDEGTALLQKTLAVGAVGPYQLQAAIAAIHDEAARPEDTDWAQIAALYGLLMRMSRNPMAVLSHAVAVAMTEGPAAGLALLEPLDKDERIAGHFRIDAVRGHLHERAGNRAAAVKHYQAAADRTSSIPERNYLLMRASKLRDCLSHGEQGADTEIRES